jgi:MFS family permease
VHGQLRGAYVEGGDAQAYSAMMTDIVAPEDRVRAFSLNYWAINLGFAVAPALGGLLAQAGYLTLFLADASTTLVFAVLVFLRVPESKPDVVVAEGERPGSMLDVLRDRVFMVVVGLTFLFALVFMQHLSALPVQMGDDGLSASQYGTVIALNGLLIVFVTVPLTRWLQAYDTAKVLAVSSTFVALGFGATAWASSVPAYAATVAVWTVGEVIGAATGPTVVAGLSPAAMRGRYQGLFGFSFAAAAMCAPLLGGTAYQHLGGTVLWVGCFAVSMLNAVGHLFAGPARARRFAEIEAAEGQQAVPTDAVPVPAPADEIEAEEAVR